MNSKSYDDHMKSRNYYPGQINVSGGVDLYLTGNPDSAVPLCNLGEAGMSYYPVGKSEVKNMDDLICMAEDGAMPEKIWEGQIFNHYPGHLRPSADVTKPLKVRPPRT